MQVIDCEPLIYHEEELKKKINFDSFKGKEGEIQALIEKSREWVEPKAVFTYMKATEVGEDWVQLDNGATFKSIILGEMLEPNQTVAVLVVTIGSTFEQQLSEFSKNNLFLGLFLDKIGNYALGLATSNLRTCIEKQLGKKLTYFGPGEGGGNLFGIEQQRVLFQILQPEKHIGVTLTPTYIMIPRKSISGIYAATSQKYVACEYCPRETCEYRRVPYKGAHVRTS
jgi:hypothetical protein